MDDILYGIEKWTSIIRSNGDDCGADGCPLCEKYRKDKTCYGCQIYKATGQHNCEGTPYDDWLKHHRNDHLPPSSTPLTAQCEECKEIARLELAFLRSLLEFEKENGTR